MEENKFKVGDEIIGNKLATHNYNITRKGVKGKVIDIIDDEYIKINIIGDSGTYCVNSKCFDLVKSAEPKEINNYEIF
jgi:hypothetical protein